MSYTLCVTLDRICNIHIKKMNRSSRPVLVLLTMPIFVCCELSLGLDLTYSSAFARHRLSNWVRCSKLVNQRIITEVTVHAYVIRQGLPMIICVAITLSFSSISHQLSSHSCHRQSVTTLGQIWPTREWHWLVKLRDWHWWPLHYKYQCQHVIRCRPSCSQRFFNVTNRFIILA